MSQFNNIVRVEATLRVLPDVMKANYAFWLPVLATNFHFVPVAFQLLNVNVWGVVWTVYLSWKSSQTQSSPELEPRAVSSNCI